MGCDQIGRAGTKILHHNIAAKDSNEGFTCHAGQLIQKPDKPAAELKAFAKTGELKPGESQTFTFTITARDLASYQTKTSSWIADAGTYTVKFGTSQTVKQSATFKLGKDIIVEKTNKVLVPKATINELVSKPPGKK